MVICLLDVVQLGCLSKLSLIVLPHWLCSTSDDGCLSILRYFVPDIYLPHLCFLLNPMKTVSNIVFCCSPVHPARQPLYWVGTAKCTLNFQTENDISFIISLFLKISCFYRLLFFYIYIITIWELKSATTSKVIRAT